MTIATLSEIVTLALRRFCSTLNAVVDFYLGKLISNGFHVATKCSPP